MEIPVAGTKRIVREVYLNSVGVVAVGLLLFPVWWALCVALENDPNFYATSPDLLPINIVLTNVQVAIQQVGGDIVTSLLVSLAAALIGLVIAVPTAYALKRFRVRWGHIVLLMMLLSQMVPGIALSLAFYSQFRRFDLLNSYPGLILADSTYAVPLMVVLIRAYMISLPDELFEAARVDGSGELRCLWSIAAPVCAPGIITAALFGFLGAWGDFVFALTLNSGSTVQPVTLGLYQFQNRYQVSWGPIMATVVLAAIPAGIILAVAQKWVRAGLRAGSLSG